MKIFKKILTTSAIMIMLTVILGNNFFNANGVTAELSPHLPIKVGFFGKDLSDDYLIFLRQNFEDIQKKNPGSVIFSFYDAKYNQDTQTTQLENKLREGVDLILFDMVDVNKVDELVKKISQYNVPVIFFNREPFSMDAIKSYKKAVYVGTDSKQAGILQGKMLADAWNAHKASVDKDNDNIFEYIMLIGERFNKTSIDRSTNSISTIQNSGIKTQELTSKVLNWSTDNARSSVEALFLKYGNKIEAIISNDDSMAVGAVEALQKYGYNKGDKSKVIAVVGVDGTPEAMELISKGFMLGTAFQDPSDMSNTIYTVGTNLVYGRNPFEGVPYKVDETGVALRIPYTEYTGPMFK